MKFIFLILFLFVFSSFVNAQSDGHWRPPTAEDIASIKENFPNFKEPTKNEVSKLQYGTEPKNYQVLFEETIKKGLKDPFSVKIGSLKKPIKFWGYSSSLSHFWVVCGEVNAKNSFGAYTGFSMMAVKIFPNGTTDLLSLTDKGAIKFVYSSNPYPCN